MPRNPFGDDAVPSPRGKTNPFGEELGTGGAAEAVTRIEHAARKIRMLRGQAGAEGLSIPATREMLDEVAAALEATARAIDELVERR